MHLLSLIEHLFKDQVSRLEFDVEIQQKIANAARRLAREHGLHRSVKKERKISAQRAMLRLQELERKLQSAKRFQCPNSKVAPAVSSDSSDRLVNFYFSQININTNHCHGSKVIKGHKG